MSKPKANMGAAWFLLALAGIGTGLAIQEQQLLAERGQVVERVKPGFVACTSAYYLDQFNQAPHRRQIGLMLDDECLPTERLAEYPFVVLNEGTSEVNRIRLMLPDDQYADLYVSVAAVTDKGNM